MANHQSSKAVAVIGKEVGPGRRLNHKWRSIGDGLAGRRIEAMCGTVGTRHSGGVIDVAVQKAAPTWCQACFPNGSPIARIVQAEEPEAKPAEGASCPGCGRTDLPLVHSQGGRVCPGCRFKALGLTPRIVREQERKVKLFVCVPEDPT